MIGKLAAASEMEEEDEEVYGEIPDKYQCEMMATVRVG